MIHLTAERINLRPSTTKKLGPTAPGTAGPVSMYGHAPPSAPRRRLGTLRSQLVPQPPLAAEPAANSALIAALAFAGGAALAYSYDKTGYPRAPASAVPVPGTEPAEAEAEGDEDDGTVGSGPLAGPAGLLEVHESGWVAPQAPSTAITAAPDFSRSAVTFVIDLAAKPAATMSDVPPFDLNNAHIPIDCVMTITEKATGASELICLGGDCKTETVGVQHGVWMSPNADFVPIYSDKKCLTLKTYDRIGRSVTYSKLSGERAGTPQSDRAVVDVAEAFSRLDLGVHRTTGKHLATTKEVVANGLANEALTARTEFSNDRYDVVMEYPIKTCNYNNRDWFFQPDTGPVLFPNLDVPLDEMVDNMELAFIAWNRYPGSATGGQSLPDEPGWAEFVVRKPSVVGTDENGDAIETNHYSQSVRMGCYNQVFVKR